MEHLSSAALSAIVSLHKKLEASGRRLVLREIRPPLLAILKSSKLNKVLHVECDPTAQQVVTDASTTAGQIDIFAQHGLIGHSQAMRQLLEDATHAMELNDLPLLVTGETGTGKQLLAEVIHRADPLRGAQQFLTLNCSAISTELAESTFFGHEKGSFSGAETGRLGLFRAAHGGSLLLDEIGELRLDLQPKLLRVLQERRVLPLGSDYEHSVDVRIMAATNRPLTAMVRTGQFREDLYERINVLAIEVPPLRERHDDVPLLARHYLRQFASRMGAAPVDFAPEVYELFHRLSWPGNVRQLQNVVAKSLARHGRNSQGGLIEAKDLPSELLQAISAVPAGPAEALTSAEALAHLATEGRRQGLSLAEAVARFEEQYIRVALSEHGGNRTRTAATLKISQRALYEKLKRLPHPT